MAAPILQRVHSNIHSSRINAFGSNKFKWLI